MTDPNRLTKWPHQQRIRARLESDRAEKCQKAEAAEAELDIMQPPMLDF